MAKKTCYACGNKVKMTDKVIGVEDPKNVKGVVHFTDKCLRKLRTAWKRLAR